MKSIFGAVGLLFTISIARSQAVFPESNNKPAAIPTNTAVTAYPNLANYNTANLRNYIRKMSPTQPITVANQGLINVTTTTYKHKIETDYYDYLGRPLQEVFKWTSYSNRDLVKVHTYDASGRETHEYQPYSPGTTDGKLKSNVLTGLQGNYSSSYYGEEPYSKKEYDGSPLARVTKTMLPGRNWAGSNRGVSYDLKTNDAAFSKFSIGYLNTDIPTLSGSYDANELLISEVTDEDGNVKQELKDKSGKLVATVAFVDGEPVTYWDQNLGQNVTLVPTYYHTTHYVYDDFGRLRCVLPPLMNTGTITTAAVAELCYTYFYDKKGRLIEKKLPGKAVEYYVYDKLDRMVATQDGNQRVNNEWLCHLFDVLDRPLSDAIYSYSGTRDALENEINSSSQTYNSQEFMYYLSGYNTMRNPFSLSFLPTDATLITRNYYDDYNYPNLSSLSYDASLNTMVATPATAEALPNAASAFTRGLLTFSAKRVQESNGLWGTGWVYTIHYYNNKGQVIQTQTATLNAFEKQSIRYYFTGEVAATALQHTFQNATTTVAKAYHKDPYLQRISRIEQSINGGPFVTISNLTYDFLGRVANKSMGTNFNNLYSYDIHGWLTGINPSYLESGGYDPMYGPFFGEKISYDKGFASKLYNGNIAGIQWRKSTGAPKEFYGYTYDKDNRLKHAEYGKLEPPAPNTAAAWTKNFTDFTASNIKYDFNGNIKTMNQRGPTHTSTSNGTIIPGDMDQLEYEYFANSNKLKKVVENATGVHIAANPDFQDDLYGAAQDYHYDANGNLVYDANKGLGYYSAPVTYSLHNKPLYLDFDNLNGIAFTYDAAGNKLKKEVIPTQPNGISETWIYTPGGFVYKNNTLQYILHDEGRVRPVTGATQGIIDYTYDYFMKDHLGNVRSVVGTNEVWVSDPSSTNPTAPHALSYRATMEVANAGTETAIWEYLTEVTDINPFPTASEDAKAARLNAGEAGRSIGTALMLRTMPGDKINIEGFNYYTESEDPGQNATTNTEITDALLTALTGGVNVNGIPINELPDNIATLQSTVGGGSLPTLLDAMETSMYDPMLPASGLVWVVFNEDMEPMENLSGTVQASGANDWAHADAPTIDIQQPGYILIFAKSTANKSVWWNNLKVTVLKGVVLEENHYYPFGLTLSQGTTTPGEKNEYRYNGKELQSDFGLNWYNYGARQYDMQTGRWLGVDPLADHPRLIATSPYTFSVNNPILYYDADGRFPIEIHVRSFAPFNWFGGGMWKGDGYNRGFSTQYAGHSSRIRQITAYETTTMAKSSKAYGSWSQSKYGAKAFSDAQIENDYSLGNTVYTHLSGNDDALFPGLDGGPSHDIDVWTLAQIGVSENKDGSSILSLTGFLSGDGFPSSEAFVVDGTGKNKVFLGVGAAKVGPNEGPFVTLAGDYKEKQFDINIRIAVDKKGNFTGVYSTDKKGNETVIPIADWNKQFEEQNPRGQ